MSASEPKKGFLGWALEGGIYFGAVRGSGFGGFGMAALFAGAFKIWRQMETAPTSEARDRLMPLFLLFGIVGVVAMAVGYYQYLTEGSAVRPPDDPTKKEKPPKNDETQKPRGDT